MKLLVFYPRNIRYNRQKLPSNQREDRNYVNYVASVGLQKQSLGEFTKRFRFFDGLFFLPSYSASQLSPNGGGDIASGKNWARRRGGGRERERGM